jgi:hypothetical protein
VPGPRLRLLAVALLAAAVAVAAGCGGGDGGEDATSGLTPAQILARSEAAAKQVTSYRLALDANLNARFVAGASGSVATLLRQPVSVDGEGPVKEPNQAALDLSLRLGRLPVQLNLTTTGGRLYVTILGQVLEPNVPRATVRQLDLGAVRTGLLGWMKDPVEVDRPEVDGVETVHLRGGLDAAAASEDVAGVLESLTAVTGGGSAAGAQAARQIRAAIKVGSVEAWIATEDFQVRSVTATVDARGRIDLIEGLRSLTLDVDARFLDLNEPVTITAPPGARRVDLGEVLGQLGG